MTEQQPMHKLIAEAEDRAPLYGEYAAIIEAVADWLVPEEPEPQPSWPHVASYQAWLARGKLRQRQTIRQRLLDAAAEARGGGNG